MMPRLLAEESLRMADRVAVGTGSLKRGSAAKIINRWRREAQATARAKPISPDRLAVMGVGIRTVPRRRAEARADG